MYSDSRFPVSYFQYAIIIQKWWRGTLVRRSLQQAIRCALVIQKWWRSAFRQAQEKKRAMALVIYIWSEKTTVLLQSMLRMWLMKTRYKRYQHAAQVIQNNWRESWHHPEKYCTILALLKAAKWLENTGKAPGGRQWCVKAPQTSASARS
uniref:Uncharacterized protein n=1 Tax=Varanus komodoensis TaxID=61221 RepID=A0A8D2Q6B5_VARKO